MSEADVIELPAKKVWRVPSLYEWRREARKAPRWIIPGFIPHAGIVLMSGQQKLAYKTWTADLIALSLASGKEIGPFRPLEAGNVLYIQEEGTTSGTEMRMAGLIKTYGIPEEAEKRIFYAHHHMVKLDDEQWQRTIVAACQAWNVKLCILDALTYLHNADENKNSEMQKVIETIQLLRKYGVSSLALAHLDKDRGSRKKCDPDLQVRGGAIVVNAYDIHLALRRADRSQAHIDLTVRGREQEERRYVFTWDIDDHNEEKIVDGRTTILQVIDRAQLNSRELNDETKLAGLADRCHKTMEPRRTYTAEALRSCWGISTQSADAVRKILADDGRIEKTPEGWKKVPTNC